MNLTVGGLLGYSSVNSICNLNVPVARNREYAPLITTAYLITTQRNIKTTEYNNDYKNETTLCQLTIFKWCVLRTVGKKRNVLDMYKLNSASFKFFANIIVFTYPNITAFHIIILFSDGAPLTPAGGSS